MENSKLDKMLVLTSKIDERLDCVIENQREIHKQIKELKNDISNIKGDIRVVKERETFIANEQNNKINTINKNVDILKDEIQENKKTKSERIFTIVSQLIVGIILAYVAFYLTKNELIDNGVTVKAVDVESDR